MLIISFKQLPNIVNPFFSLLCKVLGNLNEKISANRLNNNVIQKSLVKSTKLIELLNHRKFLTKGANCDILYIIRHFMRCFKERRGKRVQ